MLRQIRQDSVTSEREAGVSTRRFVKVFDLAEYVCMWTRVYPCGLSFNVGVNVCSHLASMKLGERSLFYSPFKTLDMIQMCVFLHVPWLHSSLTITPSQYPLLQTLPHLYIPPSCPATAIITSAVSVRERWSHLCSSVFCVCGPSAARLWHQVSACVCRVWVSERWKGLWVAFQQVWFYSDELFGEYCTLLLTEMS